jgi:N-acetylneuraminic acid mutarotase
LRDPRQSGSGWVPFIVGIFCSVAGAEPPGNWQIRAPLPSSRTEVAAAEIGGKIYVIGGYGKNGNLVEAYDPQKDRWHRRASLPRALHHTGAAAVNGKLYVIGGYISGIGPVDTVYEYDPGANRWTAKKPMPTARARLQSA